ncbi:MAG: hypothetical protein ACE5GB_09065 [Acidimicrobiales bacterium]
MRARLLAAVSAEKNRELLGGRLITSFTRMFELTDPPDSEPRPGTSVAARARRTGLDPEEVALDLLLVDEVRAMLYVPFLNYGPGDLSAVREMLVHPHTVPGLGDGGAHVGTGSSG